MPKIARRSPRTPAAAPPKAAPARAHSSPAPARKEATRTEAKPLRSAAAARSSMETMCRSCGVRPGRPTAIIGQLTATELCDVCAALRKERIRQNRAMQRGYRI